MIVLATALPLTRLDGNRIILSVPSGKDRVEIALNVNQALFAHQALLNDACAAMDAEKHRADGAEVVPFPRKPRKAGRQ